MEVLVFITKARKIGWYGMHKIMCAPDTGAAHGNTNAERLLKARKIERKENLNKLIFIALERMGWNVTAYDAGIFPEPLLLSKLDEKEDRLYLAMNTLLNDDCRMLYSLDAFNALNFIATRLGYGAYKWGYEEEELPMAPSKEESPVIASMEKLIFKMKALLEAMPDEFAPKPKIELLAMAALDSGRKPLQQPPAPEYWHAQKPVFEPGEQMEDQIGRLLGALNSKQKEALAGTLEILWAIIVEKAQIDGSEITLQSKARIADWIIGYCRKAGIDENGMHGLLTQSGLYADKKHAAWNRIFKNMASKGGAEAISEDGMQATSQNQAVRLTADAMRKGVPEDEILSKMCEIFVPCAQKNQRAKRMGAWEILKRDAIAHIIIEDVLDRFARKDIESADILVTAVEASVP